MLIAAWASYCWRLLVTGLAFVIFGIGGLLVPLLATPVLYLVTIDAGVRQRRARCLVHWLFRGFVHTLRLLGVLRWQTEGIEKLERKGLLVLANHPTLIDVVFLVAFLPNANCIVKTGLRGNPAMRGFLALAGYIVNDEGGNLLSEAARSLAAGDVLVVFPEGTRSRLDQPLRFQRGAANVAVRNRVDITPVVIGCSPPTLSKQHKWYHIPKQRFVMSFAVKDDIAVAPFLHCPPSLGSRQLTARLEQFFTEECQAHGH